MRRLLAACCVALVALTSFAVASASPAAAAGPTSVDFTGRGWGHGRGMSQWGAQGYALDHGWSADQILNHYYGGTHAGTTAQASALPVDPDYVRVKITANDQVDSVIIAIGPNSTPSVTGAPGNTVPSDAKAILLQRSGTTWALYSSSSCGGPWTARGTGGSTVTIGRASGTEQLQLCTSAGRTSYPGSLRAFTDGNKTRTINITTAEEYLRGVVPAEVYTSWRPAALQAQAVAARSYLLAGDSRHVDANGALYADTCDTTTCQVYAGHAKNGTPTTAASTDAAIAATAGVVRLTDAADKVARTEFSSSSGGYTAGGTFPAVVDDGDDTTGNSLHTWALTKSVAPLEARCGGDFLRFGNMTRNGLGPDGGRVLTAEVVCSNQTVTLTGNEVRSLLRLYSDWWSAPGAQCTSDAEAYIDAAYQLFLHRTPSANERGYWCPTVNSGSRKTFTNALSVSDEWAGVQIDELYRHILHREPDSGRNSWLTAIRNGLRLEDVAAGFYGSQEYFDAVGQENSGYIDQLYLDLLGRAADEGGRQTWLRELESGKSRKWVAVRFYASVESRRDRVTALYQQILGRNPDAGGLEHWQRQLATIGDIVLAAELAASTEYYNRVT